MTPLWLAVISMALLAIYARYKARSMSAALTHRNSNMLPVIVEIVNDPDASDDLKELAVAIGHVSCYSVFPLYLAIWAVFTTFKSPPEPKLTLSPDEKDRIDALVNEHFFAVNVRAAAHWYLLVTLFVLPPLLIRCLTRLSINGLISTLDQLTVTTVTRRAAH